MFKKHPIIKWSVLSIAVFIFSLIGFGFWFFSLIPSEVHTTGLDQTQPEELPYLSQAVAEKRGKVLAVVSSCSTIGNTKKRAGYELSELARPYYVFQANGFDVDVASPKGGTPTMIIDKDDMGEYDYAFLNDAVARQKIENTIPVKEVVPSDYDAVYFVGGKGAMFDFPQNKNIQSLVRELYESGKVVGAVCHGPAALVNVKLQDGSPLLANKKVSGFTNEEEYFLIPNADQVFPFLLEDALVAQGARFNAGAMYLNTISQDGNLVTGQNPWSTWAFAEAMVKQMGYTPAKRAATSEENTIHILSVFEEQGYQQAKVGLQTLTKENQPLKWNLLAMHSIVAAMQWKLGKSFHLIRLLSHADELASSES